MMGQRIAIETATVVGEAAIFTTDRGLTGVEGRGFDGSAEAAATSGFAAELARRIFDTDAAVVRVFVAGNDIVISRAGGWDDAALGTTGDEIASFFLFYESPPPPES